MKCCAGRRGVDWRPCASPGGWEWRWLLRMLNDECRMLKMPRIAVIPGDGIGKEVTAEAVKAVRRVGDVFGQAFEIEQLPWGADYFLETGITLPANGYAMLRDDFDAIFIGALGDPRIPDNRHARDILLGTRFELDLYVNYRPVRLLDDRLCPLKARAPRRYQVEHIQGPEARALEPLLDQHAKTLPQRALAHHLLHVARHVL